jgi:hypothetical protein
VEIVLYDKFAYFFAGTYISQHRKKINLVRRSRVFDVTVREVSSWGSLYKVLKTIIYKNILFSEKTSFKTLTFKHIKRKQRSEKVRSIPRSGWIRGATTVPNTTPTRKV